MTLFRYRATDDGGKEVKGTIESPTKESAMDALKQLRMTPIDVTDAGAAPDVSPPTPIAAPPKETKPPIAPPPVAVKPVPVAPIIPAVVTPPPAPAPKAATVIPVSEIKEPKKQAPPPVPVSPPPSPSFSPPARSIPVQRPVMERDVPVKQMSQAPKETTPAQTPARTAVATTPLPLKKSEKPVASSSIHRYASLLSTFRLYAGWLLAYFGIVMALGYYASIRALPFDIPIVRGLYFSSLTQSLLLATFLFLLFSSLHRTMKGGAVKGALLAAIGIGSFAAMKYFYL